MNLPGFALKHKAIVVTFVLVFMLWGVLSYQSMPRREDPEYTVSTCTITVYWPGASVEKIEELITYPIESAVSSIDELEYVNSKTIPGVTTIFANAEDWVKPDAMDNVWDKVRAEVNNVPMPEPGIVPVVNSNFGDTYVMLMAVYQTPLQGSDAIDPADRYTPRELDVISERIRDAVKLVPGVARCDQFGVREEAIYVETDLGTWTQLSLTTTQLQQLLEARNIVAPGGDVDTDVGRFSVKPGGEFNAVDEIKGVIAGRTQSSTGGSPVTLTDMGLRIIRDYEDPPRTIARYGDGEVSEPCIVVAFTMKDGANVLEVSQAVKERVRSMQEIEKTVPPDIGIALVSDQAETVQKKVNDFIGNVVAAILIVVLVVYLMVGFRSAAVMAANIPIVVLGTLALMPLFGIQMEQISLASMIIALGLLVDNAVQVCDQCLVLQTEGLSPAEAAVKGSSMLGFPILIATGTTIAAFLPMLIGLSGPKSEYIFSLPVTLSLTLAISYVLAMTFCTLLASWFIRPPKDPSRPSSPLAWLLALFGKLVFRRRAGAQEPEKRGHWFRRLVLPCLKARYLTLLVSVGLLAAALMLPVGTEFFPRDLRDQFAVDIWLPEGASIEQTDAAAKEVETILRALSPTTDAEGNSAHRIRAMRTMVGHGGARWYLGRSPESMKPNFAEILIRTTDPRHTHFMAVRLREIAEGGDETLGLKPVSRARVIPRELLMGPSIDAPIGFRIYGPGFADVPKLRAAADRLADIIRAQPGVWDVHDTWGSPGYELRVDIDTDRANLAGVTNLHVAQTLNAYFSGHRLTTFREGDHLVPVYLRLPPEQRQSLEGLHSAFVEGVEGKVPLGAIANFGPRYTLARIERRDLNRMIEVRARSEDGFLPDEITRDVRARQEYKDLIASLPGGYYVELGGMLENTVESAEQMSVSLTITVLSIILLLVIQYNSWAKPIIILSTLPLALIGVFVGLYVTGNNLGFMPQLGILSLFGIVVNTAIIYIEVAEITVGERSEQSDGSGPIVGLTKAEFLECLVDAGRQRLTPIALTTLTTVLGLCPLAFFGGPLWEGMAWAMIFGLLLATVLTLIVVPALYVIFTERFSMFPCKPRD